MLLHSAAAIALSLSPLRTAAAFRSASIRLRPALTAASSASSAGHHHQLFSNKVHHHHHHHSPTALHQTCKMEEGVYWNRETSSASIHDGPIVKQARILALCDPNDAYNEPLYRGPLPEGAELLKVGTSLADFDEQSIIEKEPNVVFVSYPGAREPLVQILNKFPSVEWVHTRSAGIDFISSPDLFAALGSNIELTNAKGMFSSTLAEYCMLACSYFAKDLPRLMRQKSDVTWDQYPVLELRGATLGVVGYGDIGRASAKLAKAYGMRVLGLKRNAAAFQDEYCDEVFGLDGLEEMVAQSDYILISTPLTEQTRGMISAEVLSKCKPSAVIINVGRGPIIDEEALIAALKDGTIKGAGLDVMTVEPLPKESDLWKLDNVLLSPHNMDMTLTFMKESTEFFVQENLPRFVQGERLLNPVDKSAGY